MEVDQIRQNLISSFESFENSEQLGELAKALAIAQANYPEIPKTKEVEVLMKNGKTYKFKYADLNDITRATRKALSDQGLAVSQLVSSDHVRTILIHMSGQFISTTASFLSYQNYQEMGGGVTYLRRYCYASIIGAVSEEDDDGNTTAQSHAESFVKKELPATEKQKQLIWKLLNEKFKNQVPQNHIDAMKDISSAKASQVIKDLSQK